MLPETGNLKQTENWTLADELGIGQLDHAAGSSELTITVSELVQAQKQLHHHVLRRGTAED